MTVPYAIPRRAALFVNTKSRRGEEWFEIAERGLRDAGFDLVDARRFEDARELVAEVRGAIAAGVPLVVAGGGDGTFNLVAGEFAGRETVLGVLPLGTGNSFARDLGIPGDLPTALRTLIEGRVEEVDLGRVDDGWFVNVTTIGLTTKIAQNLTNPLKRKFGRFVYAIAMTRAMVDARPFVARLTTENGEREFETMQIVIGNGRYHAGPFPLSEEATITDARLTLYALQAQSKAAFLKLALRLPTGTQGALPEVHSEECRGGRIETIPHLPVTVDGEICRRTPIEFSAAPAALRVVVPAEFAG